MKSIKVSDYFEIIHPKYTIIRIIPVKSNKNYQSGKLANAIALSYRSFDQRIKKEKKKIFFHADFKISFLIDIYKEETCFYFIFPDFLKTLMMVKLNNIWSSCTFEEVDNIKDFDLNAYMYELTYKREDALSLNTDLRTSEPLYSIMAVQNQIDEDDRVSVLYNFSPASQFNWKRRYQETMDKIKSHQCVDKPVNTTEYRIKKVGLAFNSFLESLRNTLNEFMGEDVKKEKESLMQAICGILESEKDLSPSTKRKERSTVLDTQIAIISSSKDKGRKESNAIAVCQSFTVLGEKNGNELVYNKIKMKDKLNVLSTNIGTSYNTMSSEEIASTCLLVPGRNILEKHKMKAIQTIEKEVPKELDHGYIPYGDSTCKGNTTTVYIEDKYNKSSLPLLINGAQGSGKSTFGANYYRFASIRNEGGVVIDFIKNCELSDEIIRYVPKEKLIILDLSKEECIQSFCFNEIDISKEKSTFDKINKANMQAQQILQFVDSINPEQPLQSRMRRYLVSAATLVFFQGNTSLKEVVRCLEDELYREEIVKKLKPHEKDLLQEECSDMESLNEYSRTTQKEPVQFLIGTKESKIEGIIDRISSLRNDFKLKYMLNKDAKNNINFVNALEEGKIIIIKMKQNEFKKHAKNVITTFFLSKIWIATEIRGTMSDKPKPTHIFIDEIFQCPTSMRMIARDEILPQTRKFGCKFIFSTQYIEQIDILFDTLIGAGASFMFLPGTSEKDYNYFKNKLDPFELQDLLELKQYHSLNLIYYSGGYFTCITELPEPIKS